MSAAPSLESFESPSRAKSATFLSMETIQDQLKAIWEAIKKAFAAAKTAVVAFFNKLVDATEHVARQAEQLAHAATRFKGAPKSDTVDLGPLAHKLAVGGKLDNLMGHFADVSVLIEDLSAFDDAAVEENRRAGLALIKLFQARDEASVDAALKGFTAVAGYTAPKAFPVQKTTAEGVEYTTKELPGGIVCGVSVKKVDLDGTVESIEKHLKAVTVIDRRVAAHGEISTAAKTASASDIKLIAGGCASLAKECRALREKTENAAKSFEDSSAHIAARFNDKISEAASTKAQVLFRALCKHSQTDLHIPVKLAANVLQIARAYMAYAHKSLSQYEFEGPQAQVKEEAAAA